MSFEWKDWQYATLFIPLALGAISVLYWYFNKGNRPTQGSQYFTNGFVWVFLYLLLGLAWSLTISYYNSMGDKDIDGIFISSENTLITVHILYSFLIVILTFWPHFSKFVKIYQTMTLILAFMCLAINPIMSNLCLAPLVAWIIIRPTHD